MANRERGEVSLEAGGRRYILRPTLTAYCELEDRIGKRHTQVMVEAGLGDARATRALIWSYLQACHKDEFDTFEKAGALVDLIGLDHVQEQLKALEEANQPPPAEHTKDDGGGPRLAQNALGDSSTSNVVAMVSA